jgi:hypothetical protein|tara:strand:- start:5770 stop:6480 length:711 start_codon:yes stop_codon:yes gene_type:complete
MGLPIQKAPTYTTKLPSNGKEVKYRPFLVKEQKYLLLLQDSTTGEDVVNAIRDMITAVTFNKLDIDDLPMFDVEYLFLQIRAKSIGETVKLSLRCGETGCSGTGQVSVNIEDAEVRGLDSEKSTIVNINDEVGIGLKYPSIVDMGRSDDIKDQQEKLLALLASGVDYIYDAEDRYESDDISNEDLREFLESLTLKQLEEVSKFFEGLPAIKLDTIFKCNACQTEQSRTISGLQSFF